MWFVLYHVDVDAMYFCKLLEHNVLCVTRITQSFEYIL